MAVQVINNQCPFCSKGEFVKENIPNTQFFHWVCGSCKTHIENDMLTSKLPTISMVGAKNSTKTNYMYFLLASLEDNGDFRRAFSLATNGFINRFHKQEYNDRRSTLKNGEFLATSPTGTVSTIIYKLSRNNKKLYLTLKDTSGEEFDDPINIVAANPHIYQSDGIILLIDPLEFKEVRDVLREKGLLPPALVHTPAKEVVQNLLEAIKISKNNIQGDNTPPPTNERDIHWGRRFQTSFNTIKDTIQKSSDGRVDIPIAICIAKFDTILEMRNFYIPDENYFYETIDNDVTVNIQHIREKSEILRKILDEFENSVVRDIESCFSQVSYFPIILAKPIHGSPKRFDTNNEDDFNKGVLTPLIWLLNKLDYLK